ncbi:MAG TPA: helix-turn-helix transcriptional regulator [Ktedonobacteraceae bacterium]|nr:helix-turn-helix transcriptional regulator [Ktedonobacteraceae bacterium]
MPGDVNIAAIASLLADPTRVSVLMALGDGRALPAGELAQRARVASSTVSMHLSKLVEYGLLDVKQQGRHRYFRIANPSVTEALEALAPLAPTLPVRSLRDADVGNALRRARMCYKHLAGALGVALSQALVEKQILESAGDDYILTETGKDWLCEFGIDAPLFQKQKYLLVPSHIDWSERYPHVAGTFGMAFTERLLDIGWIAHMPTSRAIRVTEVGRQKLPEVFGISLDGEMPHAPLRKMSYAI